jgi:invasion protein IalB
MALPVPASSAAVATEAMQSAKILSVAAIDVSTGTPVSFNVSLDGFAAALARPPSVRRPCENS